MEGAELAAGARNESIDPEAQANINDDRPEAAFAWDKCGTAQPSHHLRRALFRQRTEL